jgi:glycosyltransferase involved in cell wall biosynthesis
MGLVAPQTRLSGGLAMSCVFINAFSLREGGSLVVLRELLLAMHLLQPRWSWQVATNEVALPHLPQLPGVSYHVAPKRRLAGMGSLWWHHFVLPGLLRQTGARVLFSQTNYLPLQRLGIPSLLLVQNAGHFSAVFKSLTLAVQPGILPRLALWLKGAWVRASLHRATSITVQTAALRQAMLEQCRIDGRKISVIPHGSGLVRATTILPRLPAASGTLLIGYITKNGVQKNFPVLFKAAALLRQSGLQLRLVLTLGSDPGTRQVLAEAQQLGVSDLIDNHGELPPDEIVALYRRLHLFVFPSLCESFGFPLVEALASGLPLLVADTPSNVELAGEGALVFAPHDAAALAAKIMLLANDTDSCYEAQACRSLRRAREFSWERAAADTTALLQQLLPAQERS